MMGELGWKPLNRSKGITSESGGVVLNWSKSDVSSIKEELSTGHHDSVERLSNRLGVDEISVRDKIEEIKLRERIRKLARETKEGLKEHRGKRFRKYGTKIKRKVRSRMRNKI